MAADLKYERPLSADPLSEDALVLGLVGRGNRVLELGCHSGYLGAEMQARGNEVVGLDIDREAVDAARTRGLDARVADLNDPGALPSDFDFDVVVAANVLEHLADPARLVRAIADRGPAACRLVVSVPNVAFYKVRVALLKGQFTYDELGILDRTHLRFFTRATLRELLEQNGWRVSRELSSPGGGTNRRAAVVRRVSRRWPALAAIHLIVEATLD